MAEELKDKTVIVTGGSRGIGAAIARRFGASGARVVIGYRSDSEAAARVEREIVEAGGACLAARGDVSEQAGIDAIVHAAVQRFGPIDILVNCAAIAPYRPLGAMDAAFVRSILDANVVGLVMMTQSVLPHMPAPGGRIVNIASALAYRPIPTSSVYSASKAAVVTLTHAFAKELGPRGITVNAVAPGVIRTDMTESILVERGAQILAMTPLARIGETDDIAGIVTFLASPEAGWITGRTIIADGGVT